MLDQYLRQTRNVLTIVILLNLMAFFILDLFMPDSHFRSSVWPLHSRLHAGAAATISGVYVAMGIYSIWFPSFDLVHTMRWVAKWMATYNAVFLAFTTFVMPFFLGSDDHLVSWHLGIEGAGNDPHAAAEGLAYLTIGLPTLGFFFVLWRLRDYADFKKLGIT